MSIEISNLRVIIRCDHEGCDLSHEDKIGSRNAEEVCKELDLMLTFGNGWSKVRVYPYKRMKKEYQVRHYCDRHTRYSAQENEKKLGTCQPPGVKSNDA